MKNYYYLLIIGSMALLWCAPKFAAAQSWQITTNTFISTRFEDMFFLSPTEGYIVNGEGFIYRTEDGGDTWQGLFHTLDYLRSVEFLTSEVGFVGSLDGTLFRTTDGGEEWLGITDHIPGSIAGICGMSHIGTETIMGVGTFSDTPVFIRSDDQGDTWTHLDLSDLASGLVEVHFFDDQNGIIGGISNNSGALVLRTEDGGQTWENVFEANRILEFVWKFDVVNDNLIYGTVENYLPEGSGRYIIKSEDGGLTWEEKLVSPNFYDFQGIGFRNELEGWVCPRNSGMFHTIDGGETWTQDNTISNINRIWRIDENLLYACGSRVYRYGDLPTNALDISDRTIIPKISDISPNPFGESLSFVVDIPPSGEALVEVFDQNGKRQHLFENRNYPSGPNTFNLNQTEGWPPGVYYISVRSKEGHAAAKIVKK